MAIAKTVSDYLSSNDISPDVVKHPRSATSSESAQLAHISGHHIAKGIVLQGDGDPALVVVPASHNVALAKVREASGANFTLAEEDELSDLFPDCKTGAVPAVGMAYQLPVYVDETLFDQPEVFFEGGDHESLVRLSSDQFKTLFGSASVGQFGDAA